MVGELGEMAEQPHRGFVCNRGICWDLTRNDWSIRW